MKRYTAPYIIGCHLGWDIREVSEGRYQRAQNPSLYVCGGDYFCSPTKNQKPPKEYKWIEVGECYGRKVYRSS